ncbi:radical SAM family heme chaperone HemW [Staphylococcus lutrae]|uniref:Heme chaperone HemW n=1 Tax=Staphylococcus lutrae TaxID=155085 RepID=A0AAC9RS88_9STAP|nr:radical SAM family heme chaperone HemW [Staphylococcus lutrae]ARJ49895.1 coproporphyrinogen III oxidase [Staphylococcus lutrae]PNZ38630.1 coproporphyrinogen III oxidase [Staphylococcus lutrae]
MEAKSAYIHIPFCVKICTYCDFNKYFIQHQPVDEYLACLVEEMKQAKVTTLDTLFVGGGTPTALSEAQLEYLLKAIHRHFIIKGEFTFEANPDELTSEKVALLKAYGVNRLSIGVQTFDDTLLKTLGRSHTNSDIYQAIRHARHHQIPSISLDLMYHLPGQSMKQFQDSLDQALQLDIDHLSSYGLILEPQTQFYNQYRKGKLTMPDEDIGAEMYQYLMSRMKKSDLNQYEISNFAKKGHESVHNQVYWKNEGYYGFGAGASGYVDGMRYTNVNPVNHYIKKVQQHELPRLSENYPTVKEQMEEEMFLGLRMNQGVSRSRFKEKFDVSIESIYENEIQELQRQHLIQLTDTHISLTDRGRMVGNSVFEAFIKV